MSSLQIFFVYRVSDTETNCGVLFVHMFFLKMKIFINVIIILSEKDTVERNKVMDNTLDESKNFDVQVPEKHAHGYGECM